MNFRASYGTMALDMMVLEHSVAIEVQNNPLNYKILILVSGKL